MDRPDSRTTDADVMLWECPRCGDLVASDAINEYCDCTQRRPYMICRRHATDAEIAEYGRNA